MNKVIKLKKIDVNALKMLFSRSLSVSNLLGFSLSSEEIESLVSNDSDSFFKHWKTSTAGIFESETFEKIRVVIFNGSFFSKTVLPYFADSKDAEMHITVNEKNEALLIELFGNGLQIKFKTARIEMSKDAQLTAEDYEKIFNFSDAFTSFTLSKDVISKIDHLKVINAASDNPVDYVLFKGHSGKLSASDTSFILDIGEYSGEDFEAKFNKQFLPLIDSEDHVVYYMKGDVFDRFVMQSKHSSIVSYCSSILMKEIGLIDAMNDELENPDWSNFEE